MTIANVICNMHHCIHHPLPAGISLVTCDLPGWSWPQFSTPPWSLAESNCTYPVPQISHVTLPLMRSAWAVNTNNAKTSKVLRVLVSFIFAQSRPRCYFGLCVVKVPTARRTDAACVLSSDRLQHYRTYEC